MRNDMNNMHIHGSTASTVILPPPRTFAAPPAYLPQADQALQMHKKSIEDTLRNADYLHKMAEFMVHTCQANPGIAPEADALAKDLMLEVNRNRRDAQIRQEGIRKAGRIVNYYQTPIEKPIYGPDTDHVRPYFNLKEVIMVAGYFDPADGHSDFKHVWQKLLDYGEAHEFQERQYFTALGALLKKDAYEVYYDFKTAGRSLDEMLEYFAKVYTKKRSLIADRHAVDQFTRKKGESIIVCMDRCIVDIDKLRHLYPESGWAEMRQQMRRNILMQVIKEETKRHVQMEEDDITESTGMPYDFEKLIRLADRYERHHNAAPEKEVTTLFKVASGGLVQKAMDNIKTQDQLQHFKKEQMLEKKIEVLQAKLEQIEVNAEGRPYKNEGRSAKAQDNRRRDRSDSRTRSRDQSWNKNRNFDDMDTQVAKPTTNDRTDRPAAPKVTYQSGGLKEFDPLRSDNRSRTDTRARTDNGARPESQTRPSLNQLAQQAKYTPPNPYDQRAQSRSPNRWTDRARSQEERPRTPYVAAQGGNTPYRNDSQNRERSYSGNRPWDNRNSDPRSNSGNRNWDRQRSNSGNRNWNSQGDNSGNRNWDRQRNNSTNRNTNQNRTDSKSKIALNTSDGQPVYITINGQNFVAEPNRSEN
jgi:hypothetical protein